MHFWTDLWSYLQETKALDIVIRILLAAIAGGLIGVEREFHGRAAGLRTHMLVSVGAVALLFVLLFYLCCNQLVDLVLLPVRGFLPPSSGAAGTTKVVDIPCASS